MTGSGTAVHASESGPSSPGSTLRRAAHWPRAGRLATFGPMKLVVAALKGGVGKTTTSVYLSAIVPLEPAGGHAHRRRPAGERGGLGRDERGRGVRAGDADRGADRPDARQGARQARHGGSRGRRHAARQRAAPRQGDRGRGRDPDPHPHRRRRDRARRGGAGPGATPDAGRDRHLLRRAPTRATTRTSSPRGWKPGCRCGGAFPSGSRSRPDRRAGCPRTGWTRTARSGAAPSVRSARRRPPPAPSRTVQESFSFAVG